MGITIDTRDGVGFFEYYSFAIIANSADAEILLMEVPMRL
jgi:hypothetical protein